MIQLPVRSFGRARRRGFPEKLLNYNTSATLLVYASSRPRFSLSLSLFLSLSVFHIFFFLSLTHSLTLEFRTSLQNLDARLSEVATGFVFS